MTGSYSKELAIYLRVKDDGRVSDCDQDLSFATSAHDFTEDTDIPPSFDFEINAFRFRGRYQAEMRVFVETHDDVAALRERFNGMFDALDKHVADYEKRREQG